MAITPFDPTVYPHQQVLNDTKGLDAAIDALKPPTPDATRLPSRLWAAFI